MNKKNILQNMSVAFLAQGVSMMLSIIQTLLVPKLLGVEQYGYWQLYIFYISYVGFFHLGLSSGVYLLTGGLTREQMDKAAIKSQMIFGLMYQTGMAVVIVVFAGFLGTSAERGFVIIMTAVYLVLQNLATFMMNELQCMNETKKSSYSTIIERLTFLVPLIVFLVLRVNSFYPYVLAYTVSTVAQIAYCVFNLQDFWSAKWLGIRSAAQLSWSSIKIGFPMMLANIMGMLILGIGRVFIDIKWGIETFGRLSLSLSLVSFFLAFVSQASMVLFPSLRQATNSEVRSFYCSARDAMELLSPAIYALYFPLTWILSLWLPSYADSFIYLILLLPICVFDSKFNIIGATYFNVLRRERVMLALNAAIVAIDLFLTALVIYVFDSVLGVMAVMTLSVAIRGLWAELYMNRELGAAASKSCACELLLTVEFVLLAFMLPTVIAFVLFTVSYACFLFFFRQNLTTTIRKLRA